MRIDHLAIWVDNLELMKEFYHNYFGASFSNLYENPVNGYASYFMEFSFGIARIELMHRKKTASNLTKIESEFGLAHFAIGLGSQETVISLTEQLRNKGVKIIGEPRTTGDGYFESIILDPEGNKVELTV